MNCSISLILFILTAPKQQSMVSLSISVASYKILDALSSISYGLSNLTSFRLFNSSTLIDSISLISRFNGVAKLTILKPFFSATLASSVLPELFLPANPIIIVFVSFALFLFPWTVHSHLVLRSRLHRRYGHHGGHQPFLLTTHPR